MGRPGCSWTFSLKPWVMRGLIGGWGLRFGADRMLYLAGNINNQVGRFGMADGSYVDTFVASQGELNGARFLGFVPAGGAAARITGMYSLTQHGPAGVFAVPVGLEPRATGISTVEVALSDRANAVTCTVECELTPYTGAVSVDADGTSTVRLSFDPALPDADCCRITLKGDAAGTWSVRPLRGDITRDGIVTTADASLIKPHYQETVTEANFIYDYNADGQITTSDFSLIKPLYQRAAPACP